MLIIFLREILASLSSLNQTFQDVNLSPMQAQSKVQSKIKWLKIRYPASGEVVWSQEIRNALDNTDDENAKGLFYADVKSLVST